MVKVGSPSAGCVANIGQRRIRVLGQKVGPARRDLPERLGALGRQAEEVAWALGSGRLSR